MWSRQQTLVFSPLIQLLLNLLRYKVVFRESFCDIHEKIIE